MTHAGATHHETTPHHGGVARRIDRLSWAAAFIWLGAALLAGLQWGWLLAGLGVVTLAAQGLLLMAHERTSGFWIVTGAVLLGSGVWELSDLEWPLAPVVFIVIGVALLLSALRSGRSGA